MLKLTSLPKNPTIIIGFPGFGLVGTICTEFLLEHLNQKQIGKIWFEELPAVVAIHKQKMIDSIGIHYNLSKNILIIHAITGAQGLEWKIAKEIADIAKKVKAKEVITLEGIGSKDENSHNVFYYANHAGKAKLQKAGLKPLQEGIVIGMAGALCQSVERPLTCIFAETHSELPDSKASAVIIEAVDKYLGFKIDTRPLLELATKFEEKLKGLMTQSKTAQTEREKKMMSYVG
ncbi:MAG: PAC2 family protein, partial [Nanoarchaeota archaeon]